MQFSVNYVFLDWSSSGMVIGKNDVI
jgi:hypothetical protein